MRLLPIPLCCILLAACTSPEGPAPISSQAVAATPASQTGGLPSWFSNPPRDTGNFIHATGIGANVLEARQDALATLAGKLSVTVSSEFQQTIEERQGDLGGMLESSSRLDLNNEVSRLRLTRYETLKESSSGDVHTLLIRIEKGVLLRDLKARLQDVEQQLANQESLIESETDSLEKLKSYQRLRSLAMEAHTIAYVLLSFDPNFNIGARVDRINEILRRFAMATRDFRFHFNADPHSSFAENLIEDRLREAGLRILRDPAEVTDETMVVQIRSNVRYTRQGPWTIAQMRTRFTLREGFNSVISEEMVESSGISQDGNRAALENASLSALEELKEKSILEFVGLIPGLGL